MASLAPGISPQHATSLDLSHNIMTREGYDSYERDDWRILTLNDAAEDALSKILRFGFDIDRDVVKTDVAMRIKNQILAWAKHISDDIPGYSNWQEVYDFTFDALDSPDAVPGEDATPIGTEADLVNETADYYQLRDYALLDRGTEKANLAHHALSLIKARNRQEILDLIRAPYSATNPMPHDLALLFRKIRYTYKLRECLLGQAGYYNGAQEFVANRSDDFEFYMYLVQMKLRRPDHLHIFKAPKAMANYITDSTSLLPWNNQFSYPYSLDDFGPHQKPLSGVNYIERKLAEVLRLDKENKKWRHLCTLLSWDPNNAYLMELSRIKREFVTPVQAENTGLASAAASGQFLAGNLTLNQCGFRALTLPHIIGLLSDEVARKSFYMHILELTWSDMPLWKEDNPFSEMYKVRAEKSAKIGAVIYHDLTHLLNYHVKDPKIAGGHAAHSLAHTLYYPQVADRRANFIPTPETAGKDYHRKLLGLGEPNLDLLFNNIPDYPHTEDQVTKVDAVVNQAVNAARDWQTSAIKNHHPIYNGTSGHILSYSRLFVSSEEPTGCKKKNHPTLEQLRLTLLAGLIGFNQHHSYDECMTASHGFTHRGVMLEYKDRKGFRDIFESEDVFIRDTIGKLFLNAMVAIGKQAIANFDEQAAALDPPLPAWDTLVAKWFKDMTGYKFPTTPSVKLDFACRM